MGGPGRSRNQNASNCCKTRSSASEPVQLPTTTPCNAHRTAVQCPNATSRNLRAEVVGTFSWTVTLSTGPLHATAARPTWRSVAVAAFAVQGARRREAVRVGVACRRHRRHASRVLGVCPARRTARLAMAACRMGAHHRGGHRRAEHHGRVRLPAHDMGAVVTSPRRTTPVHERFR